VISYAADTHALIWHLMGDSRLGAAGKTAFNEADAGRAIIYISAISLIEIVLLAERGKVPPNVLPTTFGRIGIAGGSYVVVPVGIPVVVAFQGIARSSIPEMPDRLIAATAVSLSTLLITRDHAIVNSGVVPTIW
jgi:PIN domain nuclease of toxin-antitoxin system